MRFLGSKFTQNALAARALPRTPLLELKRSPRPLADFRGRRGKGKEGKGKGEKRYWGRERGREGKGRGEGGRGRRREREGRGSLRHWR